MVSVHHGRFSVLGGFYFTTLDLNHSSVMGTSHGTHALALFRYLSPAELLCRLSTPSDRLVVHKLLVESRNCSPYIHICQLFFLSFTEKPTTLQVPPTPKYSVNMEERLRHKIKSSLTEKHFPFPLHPTEV